MLFFRKPLAALALVLIAGTAATAQGKLTDSIPQDPALVKGKLANGLTYYIRQNKKAGTKSGTAAGGKSRFHPGKRQSAGPGPHE